MLMQNFCLELSTGVRPVLLLPLGPRSSWFVSLTLAIILGSQARSSSASQFCAYAPLLSPALLHHLAPFAVVLSRSLIRSEFPSIGTGAVWTLPCAVWALRWDPGPMMCRDGNNQQAAGWLGLTWLLVLQPKT